MSERLQVLLPDREMSEIQRIANRVRGSVGEWVRRVLRDARDRKPSTDAESKLKAIRHGAQMLREIRAGIPELIFIDSSIPMYLVGAPHPHKSDAQLLLERLVTNGQRLVTDAEVLQEIIHRYAAIQRREAMDLHFTLF